MNEPKSSINDLFENGVVSISDIFEYLENRNTFAIRELAHQNSKLMTIVNRVDKFEAKILELQSELNEIKNLLSGDSGD